MPFELSQFGERFTRPTGALELMDDLGQALEGGDRSVLMLGGGNPGRVPAVHELLRRRLREIAASESGLERMLEKYAHPTGELEFRRSLAALLRREYGWRVTADNVALTAGSQAAFFLLFNLFAGVGKNGARRRILLPVTPEYVGYADVGLGEDFFVSSRPAIEELPDRLFKYHPNFARLELGADTAALCVSRPTNPTGNVLTDDEVARLDGLARARGVPFIIDGAYGPPFPDIVFGDAAPLWNDGVILCLSLSKLGLPAARTGIVVADESVIEALTRMTAVMSLAVGSVGPVIAQPCLDSGEIVELSRSQIKPFYRAKALRAVDLLRRELAGVPFRIHKPEGAFFLWLWFQDLPITSIELYRRLKSAGVYVLSGHYFFPGLSDAWRHRDECLRVSFAEQDGVVARGIEILAAEARKAYEEGRR
jgi:valine--pyruvate aminotransferase